MNDHQLARNLAYEAGQLLLEIRGNLEPLPDGVVAPYDQKALGDRGDREANNFLIDSLRSERLNDVIFSEESADPFERLTADRVWMIDPLDGTSSFTRGYPGFAVHVALWERIDASSGAITAAAVSVPLFHTTLSTADDVSELSKAKELATPPLYQERSERDNIRIVTSPSRPPTQMDIVRESLQSEFNQTVEVQRMGSVGAKTTYIILGGAEIYINTSGFHQWDIAAPLGIAEHYGLNVCLPSGSPIVLNQPKTDVGGALIAQPEFVPNVIKSLA